MTWLVFVAVGLMLFGSIYWLKPSARDQRLADLRLSAIRAGLQIRQQTFKVDSARSGVREDITATGYTLMLPAQPHGEKPRQALLFRVVGQTGWETAGLPDGWAWHDLPAGKDHDRQLAAAEQLAPQLVRLLSSLDDGLVMLEVFENRITLFPAEQKTASAEKYLKVLEGLKSVADGLKG
ncbi:hypothetical protein [Oceanobacter mangrovi]|uniref:hypothetical protein n=1 Tax=Oceanobacter mangrovi TaxID=2862510 RepID=UPI001C8E2BC6|nr:hypothetical protein [Oceanobacter mangrovi]